MIRNAMRVLAAFAVMTAGCGTGDKGATSADTATSQTTTVAPANTSGPVLSAPAAEPMAPPPVGGNSTDPRSPATPARPRTTGTTSPMPVPAERDSAFKPRATVDEQGNIQPIKRDSLR